MRIKFTYFPHLCESKKQLHPAYSENNYANRETHMWKTAAYAIKNCRIFENGHKSDKNSTANATKTFSCADTRIKTIAFTKHSDMRL